MNVAVQTGSDDLKEFAQVAGMSAKDFAAAYKQDAAGAFMMFIEGLAKGGDQAVVMLDKMGITETRMRDMLLRATGATELMRSGIATANKAWDQNNALAKEAAMMAGISCTP